MKKLSFTILFVLAVTAFGSALPTAARSATRIFDEAGVFEEMTDREYTVNDDKTYDNLTDALDAYIISCEEEAGFVIAALITDDLEGNYAGESVKKYADKYYANKFGSNTDGVMLLINLDNEIDCVTAFGKCADIFSSARVTAIFDNINPDLNDEDYSSAVQRFCTMAVYYGDQELPDTSDTGSGNEQTGTNETQSNYSTLAILIIIIDVVVIICFIKGVKLRYKIKPVKYATNYLNRDSIKYAQKSDTFIRTYVTKVKVQSSDNHRGGGGSRGGGGGGGGRIGGGVSSGRR